MKKPSRKIPSYRLHKASGQAVVKLCGKERYLGKYGTAASKRKYHRLVGQWLSHGRKLPNATGRRRRKKPPAYRLHKASGQAVVRIGSTDQYLGKYGSEASRREYERLIADWQAEASRPTGGGPPKTSPRGRGKRQPAPPPAVARVDQARYSIAELLRDYHRHAKQYYGGGGKGSGELRAMRYVIGWLLRGWGPTRAADFGPLALRQLRDQFIDAGHARRTINQNVNRVRRIFRWGVENEKLPADRWHALRALTALRRGRTTAREPEPVECVSREAVEAVRPYVARQVWAIVELQWLTGARGGEIALMRACDIDMAGRVWDYRPAEHKNAWRGHERVIPLGPAAQKIVKEFLKADTEAYLFSPADAMAELNAARRASRKTPLWPSHAKRRGRPKRRRLAGDHYTKDSYHGAITRACDRAFPPPEHLRPKVKDNGRLETEKQLLARLTEAERAELKAWRKAHRWHPHQLRHSFATRIRREYDLDAAQAALGHRNVNATEIYAQKQYDKAVAIALKHG